MKYDREKVVNYLEKQINGYIEFDNCPSNESGWHEVKRENIYKILDGLIPMLKTDPNKHRPDPSKVNPYDVATVRRNLKRRKSNNP